MSALDEAVFSLKERAKFAQVEREMSEVGFLKSRAQRLCNQILGESFDTIEATDVKTQTLHFVLDDMRFRFSIRTKTMDSSSNKGVEGIHEDAIEALSVFDVGSSSWVAVEHLADLGVFLISQEPPPDIST